RGAARGAAPRPSRAPAGARSPSRAGDRARRGRPRSLRETERDAPPCDPPRLVPVNVRLLNAGMTCQAAVRSLRASHCRPGEGSALALAVSADSREDENGAGGGAALEVGGERYGAGGVPGGAAEGEEGSAAGESKDWTLPARRVAVASPARASARVRRPLLRKTPRLLAVPVSRATNAARLPPRCAGVPKLE